MAVVAALAVAAISAARNILRSVVMPYVAGDALTFPIKAHLASAKKPA
jgi:hypothetical protein